MIFLVEVWLRQYLLILKSYLLFIWNSSLTGHSKCGPTAVEITQHLLFPQCSSFSQHFYASSTEAGFRALAHVRLTTPSLSFPFLTFLKAFYVTSRPTPPITLCLSMGIRPIYCPWWRTGAPGGGWRGKVKCIRHLDHPRNLQWTHR